MVTGLTASAGGFSMVWLALLGGDPVMASLGGVLFGGGVVFGVLRH